MLPGSAGKDLLFDLSGRTKLRLTGKDRIRFINGQITNDLRKASETSAIAACVLNAKGRLNADIVVSVQPDSVLIDAEPALREALPARLERYVIADDVQIEDVTERFSIFHVLAEHKPEVHEITIAANRFGQPGFDIWSEAAKHEQVGEALAGRFSFCGDQCAETFRIEKGIPRWGIELTEDIIPVEANLEESCLDYYKGCYIGQEVISRMKMSGQRNKSLCGLVSSQAAPLEPGMRLYPMGEEKKEQGWITSAAWSDRLGKQIALGYVRRPFNRVGAQLDALDPQNPAGSALVRVQVVSLPFSAEQRGSH